MADTGWIWMPSASFISGWSTAPPPAAASWRYEDSSYNGNYAKLPTYSEANTWGSDFGIPDGVQIDGIEVRVRIKASYASYYSYFRCSLSSDSGSTWTSTLGWELLGNVYDYITLGGPTYKWGRTWVKADFSTSNFVAKVGQTTTNGGGATSYSDTIWFKVYYSAGVTAAIKKLCDKDFPDSIAKWCDKDLAALKKIFDKDIH